MKDTEQILVTRSSMPPFEEYCEEIRSLWDSHWITNRGEKYIRLEDSLKEYLDVPQLSLFVNGHNALETAIEAMELGSDGRDEVITTPFTFVSTTNAIVRKGLKPIFCDIREDNLTIDANKIEDLITDRTCAIIPVHVYGNLCEIDAIKSIADKHDLKVIYDAAHAFGVERDGVGVANFGDASIFSFHATKVFNTIEGGAVAHADKDLQRALHQFKNFGIAGSGSVKYVGGNAKLNEFAAAMGICNLRYVDVYIAKRRAVAERYWDNLKDVPGIQLVKPIGGVKHNYAYLPILIDPNEFGLTRDGLFEKLAEEGISARKYFYPLTSDFEVYADKAPESKTATPVAYYAAESVLTLPMYADLSLEDVDRICEVILNLSNPK